MQGYLNEQEYVQQLLLTLLNIKKKKLKYYIDKYTAVKQIKHFKIGNGNFRHEYYSHSFMDPSFCFSMISQR